MAARVSRHRFAREPPQSDDNDCLFNPQPPVVSSPSSLLPASFSEESREKERESKGAREGGEGGVLTAFVVVADLPLMADGKRPRDEEFSAEPRGLLRVCRELFRGRYLSALSSFAVFMVITARS